LVKQPLDRDRKLGGSRAAAGTETDSYSEAGSDIASKSLQFASSPLSARALQLAMPLRRRAA